MFPAWRAIRAQRHLPTDARTGILTGILTGVLTGVLIVSSVMVLPSTVEASRDASDEARTATSGGDVFVAGGNVTRREPVAGDLFAAGGSLEIEAPVAGDAILAAGRVRLRGDIARSLYAAGGQVEVNAKVARNARFAGGQVELGRDGEVSGNVSIAGGQVRLHGPVRGSVQAAGGRVLIDSTVGGDVVATSGQVELGPQARIGGALRVRSGDPVRRDPAAQVAGPVELIPWAGRDGEARRAEAEREARGGPGVFSLFWTAGLMLLAAVAIATLPHATARIARTWRERSGISMGIGFIVLACAPLAALLLVLTIVGIPLALVVVLTTLALLPLGYVASAIGLGDWALGRWRSTHQDDRWWRIGAACAGVLVLALLGAIPFVGWIVGLAALLAGLGALAQQWRHRDGPDAAATAAAA